MWTDLRSSSAAPVRSSVSEMPVSSRCASNRAERPNVPIQSLSGYSTATSALSGMGLVIAENLCSELTRCDRLDLARWKYQQWAATFPKRLVMLCDRPTILARRDRQEQTAEAA